MKIKNFLPVCAAILLIAACTNKQDAVFSVNGTKISKATYQGTVDNLAAQYVRVNPNFLQNQQNQELIKKLALEQLITNEVLYQEAKKQNVKADEKAVKQNMEKIKNLFAFHCICHSDSIKTHRTRMQHKTDIVRFLLCDGRKKFGICAHK